MAANSAFWVDAVRGWKRRIWSSRILTLVCIISAIAFAVIKLWLIAIVAALGALAFSTTIKLAEQGLDFAQGVLDEHKRRENNGH